MAGRHVSMLVHFVWSVKERRPLLNEVWRPRLFSYLGGVMRKKNAKILRAGGMADHIHLLVSLPSTLSLADAVNAAKANSSRWIHETIPDRRAFAWQEGYGAFSVSKSAEGRVTTYIDRQAEHHRRMGFQDEFRGLLKKHGIEFDEKYLWR